MSRLTVTVGAAVLAGVIGAAGGALAVDHSEPARVRLVGTETPRGLCPAEDSCRAEYSAGGWVITVDQP